MSGFTENAANAPEHRKRRKHNIDLETAQRMLSLVRRIVADLVQHGHHLAEILPEQERLDRKRRGLDWPERLRRYQLQEEAISSSRALQLATTELEALGIVLVNSEAGMIGFPTQVNDKAAFFSWRPGEEGIHYWHFVDETNRRVIPPAWLKAVEARRVSKR